MPPFPQEIQPAASRGGNGMQVGSMPPRAGAMDPDHRFWNPEFGYETERTWHFMDVVWSGPANGSRQLEI